MSTDVSRDEIVTIVRLVDQSPCRDFKLAIGGLRLKLGKEGASPLGPATGDCMPAPPGADAMPLSAAPVTQAAPRMATERNAVDGVKVAAPMLGIFYRAPTPGRVRCAPLASRRGGLAVAMEAGSDPAAIARLETLGHVIRREPPEAAWGFGGAQLICRVAGGYVAGSDHRKDGCAIGY